MPLISPDAAAYYARERMKIKEETITSINEFLVDETVRCFTINRRDKRIAIINTSQLYGADPRLVACMLKEKGWNVTHHIDQRDGEWLRVVLP